MGNVQEPAHGGLRTLRDIGEALDRDEYPMVGQDGLVMPGARSPSYSPGEGERVRVEQPEAGSEGPAAREGEGSSAAGSAAAGGQALLLGQLGLSEGMRHDLGVVAAAYPSLRVRVTPPVVWLLSTNRPIEGLPDKAYLLTAISMDAKALVPGRPNPISSWAWWDLGIWIGPRHTNYGDGSICSFEPKHGTWRPGESLIKLLDLHSVWIARQLHLRHLGRWPGDQVIHTAYERVAENAPDELCGCGSFRRYDECHRALDEATPAYQRDRGFHARMRNPARRPPSEAWAMLGKLRTAGAVCPT